jgi:hypothetical protein
MAGLDASIWALLKSGKLSKPLSIAYDFGSIAAGEKRGIDIAVVAGAMSSNTGIVGVNSVVSALTVGSAMWAAAFYGKVDVGTVHSIGGYIAGAEFEVAIGAGVEDCNRHVLVLNYTSEGTVGHGNITAKSFIQCRNYGTQKMDYLFDLPDEVAGAARMLRYVDGSEPTWTNTVYIKCRYGTTDFWIVGTADTPNS